MEVLKWYELGYYEEEDFDDDKEIDLFLGKPCPLDITEAMVEEKMYEDLKSVSVLKDEYNSKLLEDICYERLVKKFKNATSEQKDALRKRVLAIITDAIVKKEEFYAYQDWSLIKKELLLKSKAKEWVCDTIDEVCNGNIFITLPEYAEQKINDSSLYYNLLNTRNELYSSISKITEENLANPVVEGYKSKLNENISAIDNGINNVREYIIDDTEGFNLQKTRQLEEIKKNLEINLKKRFGRKYLLLHYFPNVVSEEGKFIDGWQSNHELSNDIYFTIAGTENWKMSTPSFKEEFDGILRKTFDNPQVRVYK